MNFENQLYDLFILHTIMDKFHICISNYKYKQKACNKAKSKEFLYQ